jgi:antitoxin FitA
MAQVLIRQLDEQVVAALRARAQAQGLLLEQSLCDELAQLRATTPSGGLNLNIAALIRDDRDGR